MKSTQPQKTKWWHEAVFYEIASVSFQDSNGDGMGDLPGLISRIGYLEWLGVKAIWLTPIYSSPMLDLGYDVSDFCAVSPYFGTMENFDELIESLHSRDIRLILDFVPNHTSDGHSWFLESRSSRENPKRDWYLWADPSPSGGPPNNWLSRFGGSAWQWDDKTEQYYYHAFLKEQPDLNWRNPDVREALFGVLRFWMGRGVDGFRVDASAVLVVDDLLRDDPPNPDFDEKTPPPDRLRRVFTDGRGETLAYLSEIRNVVNEFPDRVLAGEVQGKNDRIGRFYGLKNPCFDLPLNFVLIDTVWDALSLQGNIDEYLNVIPEGYWPDWVIGGHDKHRMPSKIGQGQARILAMLALTLRGTPFLFAGDELGMEQVPVSNDQRRDPFGKLVSGYGLNRDPERAPMRWDGSKSGGFTSGEPWLPMGSDIAERNVEKFKSDRYSILWLYQRLITLRKIETALVLGEYRPLRSHNDMIVYKRVNASAELLIALNIAGEPRKCEWAGEGTVLLSTYLDQDEKPITGPTLLRANEGIIVKLSG